MIYILINVVFNAFILACIMLWSHKILHITPLFGWCLAYAISGGLAILGYTRLGVWVISFFVAGRKAVGIEKTRLEQLFSDVIEQTNCEYGTSYRLVDFKIKVTDNKIVNASALGYNLIVVTCGAFEAFTDEQLRAILAHEMGHLYYRDSVRRVALIFSSFVTRVLMTLYGMYVVIVSFFSENARGEHANALALIGWLPVLMFLPIVVLNWIVSKIFYLLNRWMSRGAEYRADAFAASLGYKADMIAALGIINQITTYDNSFLSKILATHPATMLRIGALEDNEIAKQNIGRLFVATPFSMKNHNYLGVNKEVIRLVTIVVAAGILWAKYGSYHGIAKQDTLRENIHESAKLSNKPVIHNHNTHSVYIYSIAYVDKQHYKVSYKLCNKCIMQYMIVKQRPKNSKMSLANLKALQ